jgi:hypothetical protein
MACRGTALLYFYLIIRRQREEEVQLLLILVLSSTPQPQFTPGVRTHGTHCTGGWVGLRTGLDTQARGKSFVSAGDRNPVAQFVVRHYTD